MPVHEVQVSNSVKEMLTHSCPLVTKKNPETRPGDAGKRSTVAVPWGSSCPNALINGCEAKNPPVVNGSQVHSQLMTDAQISAFKRERGEKFIKVLEDPLEARIRELEKKQNAGAAPQVVRP